MVSRVNNIVKLVKYTSQTFIFVLNRYGDRAAHSTVITRKTTIEECVEMRVINCCCFLLGNKKRVRKKRARFRKKQYIFTVQ